jgi:hypothetical protein
MFAVYKADEGSCLQIVSASFMYNGWNEIAKALTFFRKKQKNRSKFQRIQTWLARNAIGSYDKAEKSLCNC